MRARDRARAAGVREVFEVARDDIAEVHLHPRDMRGAIVSLSRPAPPNAWPWGGPGWEQRRAPARVVGATVAVSEPETVTERWRSVIGGLPGVRFVADDRDRGLVEIVVATDRRKPGEVATAGGDPGPGEVATAGGDPGPGEVATAGARPGPAEVVIGGVRFVFAPNEEDR